MIMSVVIENDFQDTPELMEPLTEEQMKDPEAILERIREAGVVGMGGAMFPTAVKIRGGIGKVDTLIIGGTSLVVYPAAGLIRYFRGDHLVVINMQPTNADAEADLCIAKPIGQVLSEDVVLDD